MGLLDAPDRPATGGAAATRFGSRQYERSGEDGCGTLGTILCVDPDAACVLWVTDPTRPSQ